MSKARQLEWRKHPFVLWVATTTQRRQLFLALVVVLFGLLVAPRLGYPSVSYVTVLGVVVVISGFWTTGHLAREMRLKIDVSDIEKTPLERRASLSAKLSTPFQRSLVWVGLLVSLLLAAGTTIALVMGQDLYVWAFVGCYYLAMAFWLFIEVQDWSNDKYILTEDRILDINRIPIIYERRNEAPLAKVQNAAFTRQGIGKILDFGNVRVDTAGLYAPIIFENVSHPDLIQEAIFDQIDALSERDRARQSQRQGEETKQWFAAYHTLAGGIRDIEYPDSVAPGQAVALRWAVQGPPEREYLTWVEWDVESRLDGRSYAEREKPARLGGVGAGFHSATITPQMGANSIYFRVVVKFAGERPLYSSPERAVKILAPLPV